MKNKTLLLGFLLTLLGASAQADIFLTPGNSVVIGDQRVSCGNGGSGSSWESRGWTCALNCLMSDWSGRYFTDRGIRTGEGRTANEAFQNTTQKCLDYKIYGIRLRRDREGDLTFEQATPMNACMQN